MVKDRINKIAIALQNTASRRITVFGDYCLDKYLYTDPKRDEPSVETGLVAYQIHEKQLYPGVGGTITNNLRSMGARVCCVGLVGDDGEGYDLLQQLERIGADTSLMVRSGRIQTSTYTKPMRMEPDGTYIEMSRLDLRNYAPTPIELEDALLASLERALEDSQGVVITDQFLERNCSAITDRVRDALPALARRHPDKFFYADSRGFIDLFRGVIVKCNQFELVDAMEPSDEPTMDAVLRCGRMLRERNGEAVVVTLGEQGSCVIEEDRITQIPSFPVEGPLDIVGAGDATNAGIILGLTLGLDLPSAALLGGCISSITIQQLGVTGTATVEQAANRLQSARSIHLQEVMS